VSLHVNPVSLHADPVSLYADPVSLYAGPAPLYGEPARLYVGPAPVYGEPPRMYASPVPPCDEPSRMYVCHASLYAGPAHMYVGPVTLYVGPVSLHIEPPRLRAGPGRMYAGTPRVRGRFAKTIRRIGDPLVRSGSLHTNADCHVPIFLRAVSKRFREAEQRGCMKKTIHRRRDAHVRASGVCTEYRAIFDTAGGRKARDTLAGSVADEDHQLTEQSHAVQDRRSATAQIARSRRALRHLAKGIVQVAPLVTVDGLLMETLQRPGRIRADAQLLPYMRALHDRVSAHADAFVAEGLPADQLRKLAEEIDRFAAAKDLRAKALQRSAAAAEALRTSQDTARKNIAALEAAAMGIEADHPEILTKLRLAMRVGPRAADAAAASPPGAPAVAAAVAPASSPSHVSERKAGVALDDVLAWHEPLARSGERCRVDDPVAERHAIGTIAARDRAWNADDLCPHVIAGQPHVA